MTLVKLRFYNPEDSLFHYFPRKFKSSLRVIRASALAAEVCEWSCEKNMARKSDRFSYFYNNNST